MVKTPPASAGDIRDTGLNLGQEDPLEEGTATHSSLLPWGIPWTEEPGGPQSMGSQSIGRDSTHSLGDLIHAQAENSGSVLPVLTVANRPILLTALH